MRARRLSEGDHGRTFALVFDVDDEVVAELSDWCRAQAIGMARFTGVGAFSKATIAWFDWEGKKYRDIPVDEQVEVLSMTGDVAEQDGEPFVHAHVVLGTRDGSTRGGHLRLALVRPTLELILDETPAHLRKRHDPESGLALIELRD